MTALDVFIRVKTAPEDICRLEERIERRRALQTSCTSKPLSDDGGGHGSDDASMRLIDFIADVEELENQLEQRKRTQNGDRACCVYLAELMPDPYGVILTQIYIYGKTQKQCAQYLHYSMTHIRRLISEAELFARKINILIWDGEHTPVIYLPDEV